MTQVERVVRSNKPRRFVLPKSWTERAYRNLVYFNEVDTGRHFAAWEEPQLFSEELRAEFRSLSGSQ